MSNSRGRPKGQIEKRKTSIYVSNKVDTAWSILSGFKGKRDLSASIEYAMVEIARQVVKENDIEGKYPELQ